MINDLSSKKKFNKTITDLDGNAKRNDPLPSVVAGEEAVTKGTVGRHHEIIMKVLSDKPQTNMQIALRSGLSQSQVARRMTELERRSLAVRGDNSICPILGRLTGTWKAQ